MDHAIMIPPEVASWLPLAAIVVATASMLVTLSNRRTAREALKISETQEARRAARLDVYIKDSISDRIVEPPNRWIIAHLILQNPTDRNASVSFVDLLISYRLADRSIELKVPYDPDSAKKQFSDLSVLVTPVEIKDNGAVRGIVAFRIEPELILVPINQFQIEVHDTRGIMESIDLTILREAT